MRRAARWVGILLAVLLGLPALLALFLLGALNTDPGRRLAERAVAHFTDGTVILSGLYGRFPDALRAEHLDLRDERGQWLKAENLVLNWMPTRLFDRQMRITRFDADAVTVERLPVSSHTSQDESLPMPIVIDALRIGRLTLAPPVAGAAAVLAVEGSGELDRQDAGSADLSVHGLDHAGSYRLRGRVTEASLSAALDAAEPAHGLVGALADLPELGALTLHMNADGPWSGLVAHLALTAGALAANADGRVDVPGKTIDLDATAHAPAMTPRADVAWQSVQVDAHVHGPWAAPHAQGSASIQGFSAAGAAVQALSATLAGDLGRITVDATARGVSVPGPASDLLAATPVTLHAEARLDRPGRPVTFALTHPLLSLAGEARTDGELSAKAHLDLPDLAPFAALGAPPIEGHAALDLMASLPAGVPTLSADGVVAITGGTAPLPGLLGPDAHLQVAAALRGATLDVSRLQLDGKSVSLGVHGRVSSALDVAWQAALPDLSVLAPTIQGDAHGEGKVHGTLHDFAIDADLAGNVGTAQVPREPIKISLAAHGLPDAPSAKIAAEGSLDRAPLALDATAERAADGTLRLTLARAEWKSLHGDGALTLAPASNLPAGRITLRIDRLSDLASVVGQPVGGAATAELSAEGQAVRLRATIRNAEMTDTARAATTTLDVRVRDPLHAPEVDASLDFAGFSAAGATGTARLELKGPPTALALHARVNLAGLGDTPLQASAAARLDPSGRTATVSVLQADWQGEKLRLLAPARLSYADGVRIDGVRLGLRGGVLEVSGKLAPTLDLTAALRNLPADIAAAADPKLRMAGTIQADARLTGKPALPDGRLHLAATGLHLRSGPGMALPAAAIVADATLAGGSAQLTAKATAGRNQLGLTGIAPLTAAGAMDLHAAGALDLALFDPLIAAAGRRVAGHVTLNGSLTGTLAAPRAGGTLLLADGDVQDFVAGVHVSNITARLEGSGDTLHLVRFSGRAGPGDITASGTIGLADAWPTNFRITAKNARPLASDLLTATLDLDLALRGELLQRPVLSGTVTVDRADIRIPEKLPAKVAVLDVRRPGQPPPLPPTPGPAIGLAITLRAPGRVFVRGRGVDAELQGRFDVTGTTETPKLVGRLTIRSGGISLAGTTLNFTNGQISFEGNAIDPTLNLVTSISTPTSTATLTITGTASAPKFTLSSVPEMPQDEILAQLLFHQSVNTLSGMQLAESAAALAQISGVGSGFDPLGRIRQGLGLDRLSVGSNSSGNGATLEAGRYVAPRVYLGARQGTGNAGSQAVVQIDITNHLKLQATAGTGGNQSATGATSTEDPNGSSIGLTYQFNY